MNSVNPYNMNYYDKYISKKTNDELRESEEKDIKTRILAEEVPRT